MVSCDSTAFLFITAPKSHKRYIGAGWCSYRCPKRCVFSFCLKAFSERLFSRGAVGKLLANRNCTEKKQETHQEMRQNVNFFYDDIFNHFYAVRPGSYRIRWNNAKRGKLRRSGSFKVTDFGTNGTFMYDFLLVMIALWNRADHYIFALCFLLLSFFFLFFLS